MVGPVVPWMAQVWDNDPIFVQNVMYFKSVPKLIGDLNNDVLKLTLFADGSTRPGVVLGRTRRDSPTPDAFRTDSRSHAPMHTFLFIADEADYL